MQIAYNENAISHRASNKKLMIFLKHQRFIVSGLR